MYNPSAVSLLGVCFACWATIAGGAPPEVVTAGPLSLEIHVTRTAHVFHLVDQLAAWSPFCHQQYQAAYTDLTDAERKLLDEHAQVRQERSWGQGLEQTFYTDLELEEALRDGVEQRWLTQEQADVERRVLGAFTGRADKLMKDEAAAFEHAMSTLRARQPELLQLAQAAARFCDATHVSLPVYLIANPDLNNGGGGYNGGKLTVEVGREGDLFPLLAHEVFHAFLRTHQQLLEDTAKSTPGLNVETLSEGLAYAFMPGIQHGGGESDPLMRQVGEDLRGRKSMDDPYVRFNRYALALRPLFKAAWESPDGRLATLLPRAADVWLAVDALSQSISGDNGKWIGKKSGGRSLFILEPGRAGIFGIAEGKWKGNRYGRNHEKQFYDEVFELHIKPGDVILLAFALDEPDRIPAEYAKLLPAPWNEIEAKALKGDPVQIQGRYEGYTVVVLCAQNKDALKALARQLDLSVIE